MDFRVHRLYTGRIGSNAYVVENGGRAAVVDAGMGRAVLDFAEKNDLKIELCLLTHGHFDHIGACAALQRAGAKIGVSRKDADKLYTENNLGGAFGIETEPVRPDFIFRGGEAIDFLFSGDALFRDGVGRSDLPGGEPRKEEGSLRKILSLPGETAVYPGHGLSTTLKREKENNPYV